MADNKPKVKLIGESGNAFAVMGACSKAWKKAGKSPAEWDEILGAMQSGDYDHLLSVAQLHFDVE